MSKAQLETMVSENVSINSVSPGNKNKTKPQAKSVTDVVLNMATKSVSPKENGVLSARS